MCGSAACIYDQFVADLTAIRDSARGHYHLAAAAL
jgi:hypothetical protein